jgi:nitrate/nitrite transport system ATP-binding protein
MARLVLSGVYKGFGAGKQRREVLSNINLTVEDRELVAIVGYSGVGKTTLISLIGGLIKADAGSITLDDKPVLGPGPDRGIVFQSYALLPWLTTYDNVALAVNSAFPDVEEKLRAARVDECLALVNLTAARGKRPRELSGGMRQRVSIARALALDPEVLLLDEPLSALDALTRSSLQKELEDLLRHQRKTIVLITNDVDEALLLADRVIPLSLGPSAHLGPEVRVDMPRPRDKRQMAHDLTIKRQRLEIIDYLLSEARTKRAPRKLVRAGSAP